MTWHRGQVFPGAGRHDVREAVRCPEGGWKDLARTSSTSILRLAGVASALQNEQNIYATVKAIPYAGTGTVHTDMEYRDSEPVTSNTANTLYGDKTSGTAVQTAPSVICPISVTAVAVRRILIL